jgi:hypothetical protein
MCYHKSLVATYEQLAEEYSASFSSINEELEVYRERYDQLRSRNESLEPYTKDEIANIKNTFKRHYNHSKMKAMSAIMKMVLIICPHQLSPLPDPSEFRLIRWGSLCSSGWIYNT